MPKTESVQRDIISQTGYNADIDQGVTGDDQPHVLPSQVVAVGTSDIKLEINGDDESIAPVLIEITPKVSIKSGDLDEHPDLDDNCDVKIKKEDKEDDNYQMVTGTWPCEVSPVGESSSNNTLGTFELRTDDILDHASQPSYDVLGSEMDVTAETVTGDIQETRGDDINDDAITSRLTPISSSVPNVQTQQYLLPDNPGQKSVRPKPYICCVCAFAFARKDELITHICTHIKEEDCSCMICRKIFQDKWSLVNHYLVNHKNYRPLVCTVAPALICRVPPANNNDPSTTGGLETNDRDMESASSPILGSGCSGSPEKPSRKRKVVTADSGIRDKIMSLAQNHSNTIRAPQPSHTANGVYVSKLVLNRSEIDRRFSHLDCPNKCHLASNLNAYIKKHKIKTKHFTCKGCGRRYRIQD